MYSANWQLSVMMALLCLLIDNCATAKLLISKEIDTWTNEVARYNRSIQAPSESLTDILMLRIF